MAVLKTKERSPADVLSSKGHAELRNGNKREACALFSEAVRRYAAEDNQEKVKAAAIDCARVGISIAAESLEMQDFNEANKFLTIARDMLRGIEYTERFPK